jgi:hypothetical protein
MGTALAFSFGALVFGTLAIRADLFFRYARWVTKVGNRPVATDDRAWDWLVAWIFVRGMGAIAALFCGTIAVLATLRAVRG